jgi:hypothetical protein
VEGPTVRSAKALVARGSPKQVTPTTYPSQEMRALGRRRAVTFDGPEDGGDRRQGFERAVRRDHTKHRLAMVIDDVPLQESAT